MKRSTLLLAFVFVPLLRPQPPDPAGLARAAAVYDYGKDRAPLDEMSEAVRRSFSDPALRQALERSLLSLLSGEATHAARDYACRQLSMIGGAPSVPVLAGLLADARLGEIALYALERIPGEASAAALRKALPASSGTARIGLINAMARRGMASPLFRQWLNDPDPLTAASAADALAAAGTTADIQPLLGARQKHPAARDAALRLAERLGPAGRPVYAALWKEGEPEMARVAALNGLARIDGAKARPIVLSALASPEPAIQGAAVRLAAGMGAHAELVASLPGQSPAVQVKILTALSEAGSTAALPAFREAAASQEEAVRIAAVRALGRNGGAAEASLLARKAAASEGQEREEARYALVRLRGADSGAAIVQALPGAEPNLKVELIRAASERGDREAVPGILAAARSADRDVRREAYRGLRDIAPAQTIPELVALLSSAPAAADRREMERTLASALRRHTQASLAPVEKEYAVAPTSEAKASLLAVMGQSAREDALPCLRSALSLPEPPLRRAAILALTEWPSEAPAQDLLQSARSDSESALRILAVRGYIKLVSTPSNRTAAEVARQLAAVLTVSPQPEEKKALLAALPRFICPESLAIARSLEDDAAVAAEAKAAIERLERALTFRR